MEDAENNFMDAIAKFQEAFELVKEHGGGSASLREEIEELQAQEAELEEAKEELKGEFEEICRTYLAMEDEMAEYDQLKVRLISFLAVFFRVKMAHKRAELVFLWPKRPFFDIFFR